VILIIVRVQFFSDAQEGLDSAILETMIHFEAPIRSWPASCLPETAKSVDLDKYGGTYTWHHSNVRTEQKFEVQLLRKIKNPGPDILTLKQMLLRLRCTERKDI